ncbi:MAG: hypothetical protein HY062_11015 [Bacteroidetes bacterium]|nr:hypothetical protein [Bacteroidota bacterium]
MKNLVIIFILIISVFFVSCKKKEQKTSNDKVYTFNSLKVDHDSIAQGNVTNITADVSGDAVTYSWSASAGDIFNSGKTILFGASTCCTGNHTITCTVKDKGDHSESKSVVVKVY